MVYITKANSKRIIRKINLNDIPDIEGEVYKKPIYFLSKLETKYLLLIKTLFEDPEKFSIQIYQPVVNRDTFSYVYESEQPPAYHSNKNCERLNSKFKNFQIPFEIKQRAKEKAEKQGLNEKEIRETVHLQVQEFRAWFSRHLELFNTDIEKFLKKLDARWNIQRNIEEIEKDNSGIESIENLNLEELEKEIDEIIRKAGRFFVNNKDKQSILRRFQKLTFLAYQKGPIRINDTELEDDELKRFLLQYDKDFKKPIQEMLIQYYRVKFNPELSFKGELLDSLNFRSCSACKGDFDSGFTSGAKVSEENKTEKDDLPF